MGAGLFWRRKFTIENIKNEIKPPPSPGSVGFKSPPTDEEDIGIVSEMPPPSKENELLPKAKDDIPYEWAIEVLKEN